MQRIWSVTGGRDLAAASRASRGPPRESAPARPCGGARALADGSLFLPFSLTNGIASLSASSAPRAWARTGTSSSPTRLPSGFFPPEAPSPRIARRTCSHTARGSSGSREPMPTSSIPAPGRAKAFGLGQIYGLQHVALPRGQRSRPTSSSSASTGCSQADDTRHLHLGRGRLRASSRSDVLPQDVHAARTRGQQRIPRDVPVDARARATRRRGRANRLDLAFATPRPGSRTASRSLSTGRRRASARCPTRSPARGKTIDATIDTAAKVPSLRLRLGFRQATPHRRPVGSVAVPFDSNGTIDLTRPSARASSSSATVTAATTP